MKGLVSASVVPARLSDRRRWGGGWGGRAVEQREDDGEHDKKQEWWVGVGGDGEFLCALN